MMFLFSCHGGLCNAHVWIVSLHEPGRGLSVCFCLLRSVAVRWHFYMSWCVFHVMAVHVLFTYHGVSICMSWWFVFCLHVMVVHAVHEPCVCSCHGSSCCSCVMLFFMPWRFMLFMCQVFFHVMVVHVVLVSWCFLKSHGGSCFVYMSWWFMLFMCHLFFFHVMEVHVVHVSWCFFMSWRFMFMCQVVLFM